MLNIVWLESKYGNKSLLQNVCNEVVNGVIVLFLSSRPLLDCSVRQLNHVRISCCFVSYPVVKAYDAATVSMASLNRTAAQLMHKYGMFVYSTSILQVNV